MTVFDPEKDAISAINHYAAIAYVNIKLLLDKTCAPRTFVK